MRLLNKGELKTYLLSIREQETVEMIRNPKESIITFTELLRGLGK